MTTITSPAKTSDSLARLAIRTDGTIVGLLGIAMIAAAASAPSFTGLPTSVEYALGVLSVPFLPAGYWFASRRHVRRTAYVFAEINAATALVLLAVSLTGIGGLTSTGTDLAIALVCYTAAIGFLQYLAARRLAR